jgi:hypothetical protein
MAGSKLTKRQNKAYTGRSQGLIHKAYEIAQVHSSIASIVFIMKGEEILTFSSEQTWVPLLRNIVSYCVLHLAGLSKLTTGQTKGVVRGPNYFVTAEDAIAGGMLHATTPPTSQDEKRGRFMEALARQAVDLRKSVTSSDSSSDSIEVPAPVSNASRTPSSLDAIQEWMSSVPIESSPPFRKRKSKRSQEIPTEAGTPSTGIANYLILWLKSTKFLSDLCGRSSKRGVTFTERFSGWRS